MRGPGFLYGDVFWQGWKALFWRAFIFKPSERGLGWRWGRDLAGGHGGAEICVMLVGLLCLYNYTAGNEEIASFDMAYMTVAIITRFTCSTYLIYD